VLTILTAPKTKLLTTVAAVRSLAREALPTGWADSDHLIARVSDAIVNFCNRDFARVQVLETLPGFGNEYLTLTRCPVVAVSSVLYQGTDPVTDYTVEDPGAGLLYRAREWYWTANVGWRCDRYVVPNSERPDWWATYFGGWLLPDDDVSAAADISALAADASINSVSGAFPPLAPGDQVVVSGFTTAGNNGTFLVASTPAATAHKVPLVATLVNENAGASVSVAVRTLPYDVEEAAIESVIDWYRNGPTNRRLLQRQVGDLRLIYDTKQNACALPESVQAKLRNYVRVAVV
jgi:hypothetical protein